MRLVAKLLVHLASMRLACTVVAMALFGCAQPIKTPEYITEWQRVRSVEGCVSFVPYKGRPADISIRLKPEFEAGLSDQLKAYTLDAPLCWYEMPSGDLLLRAGPFCAPQKEAQFRKEAGTWSLSRFEEMYVSCLQKKK
ncbi:MAG TPA: hypothetical protein VJT80_15330 [Steroidobacteraceae bacterium]|nr:hypothetical protein [Steroidobacteraceae bacterium]